MKKIAPFLLATAASFATPAFACQLEVSGSLPIDQPSTVGDQFPASSIVASIANGFAVAQPFKDAKCTKEVIQAKLLLENNWSADQVVSRKAVVKLVRPITPAQTVAPVEKPAPAPTAAVPPAANVPVTATPELKESQAKLAAALQEKSRLERRAQSLKNRPAGQALSTQDRKLLNDLIVLKSTTIPELSNRVKVIEDELAMIKTNKADISWVGENFATRDSVNNLQNQIDGIKNQLNQKPLNSVGNTPAAEKGWWEWLMSFIDTPLTKLMAVLALLIAALVLFPGFRSMIVAFGRGAREVVRDLRIPDMFRREKFEPVRPLSAVGDLPFELKIQEAA